MHKVISHFDHSAGKKVAKRITRHGAISLLLLSAGFLCNPVFAQKFDPEEFHLKASDLLGADKLSGPHYRIDGRVVNKGFMNNYLIESDFGDFEADSDEQLLIRIREVGAIAELQKITKSKVFADAMVDIAKAPVELIQRVATDPVGTVKGIPAGASRLFKRTVRQVKDFSEKTNEFVQEQTSKSDEAGTGDGDDQDMVEKGLETGEQLSKQYLGYNSAIRKMARELKVDPYSSNPVLQEEMGRLAWAMTAGSYATSAVMPSLPGELSTLGDINELVWDIDPLDLQLRNEGLLKVMGIGEDLIKSYYDNTHYSTTMSNLLVGSLSSMVGTDGKAFLVEQAATAQNRPEARLFVRIAETMAAYHKKQSPITRIIGSSIVPLAQSEAGSVVAIAPIDYLVWTERANKAMGELTSELREIPEIDEFQFWVQGRISDLANSEMQALGWKLYDQSKSRL